MRVAGNERPAETDASQNVRASTQAASRSTSNARLIDPLGSDQAHLSLDSIKVQDLVAKVKSLPEIRQQKVEALQQQLRAGTYNVSSGHTAEALISQLQRQAA